MHTLLILALLVGTVSANDPNVVAALQRFYDDFADAFANNDTRTIASFYTPNSTLQVPGSKEILGVAPITNQYIFWRKDHNRVEFTVVEADVLNHERWAYCIGTYHASNSTGDAYGRFVAVWNQVNDRAEMHLQAFVNAPGPVAHAAALISPATPHTPVPARRQIEDPQLLQAIERANTLFMGRFGSGDSKGVANLYTPDGAAYPDMAAPVVGTAALTTFWGNVMKSGIKTVALNIREVGVMASDSMAFERSQYIMKDASGNVKDVGHYTVLWKRNGNTWNLYRDIFATDGGQ